MPSKSKSSSNKSHAYLGERERSAIENWSQGVTHRPTKASVPNASDKSVQAYLEAKMNLFRVASEGQSDVKQASH